MGVGVLWGRQGVGAASWTGCVIVFPLQRIGCCLLKNSVWACCFMSNQQMICVPDSTMHKWHMAWCTLYPWAAVAAWGYDGDTVYCIAMKCRVIRPCCLPGVCDTTLLHCYHPTPSCLLCVYDTTLHRIDAASILSSYHLVLLQPRYVVRSHSIAITQENVVYHVCVTYRVYCHSSEVSCHEHMVDNRV